MDFDFQNPDGDTHNELSQLRRNLAREYPDVPSVARRRFVMVAELAKKVMERQKCTTIRFDRNAIEYPAGSVLPLYSLEQGQSHSDARCLADLVLRGVKYRQVQELTESDAVADGFSSKDELMDNLETFYGRLAPRDIVCIYAFSLGGPGPIGQHPRQHVAASMVSV